MFKLEVYSARTLNAIPPFEGRPPRAARRGTAPATPRSEGTARDAGTDRESGWTPELRSHAAEVENPAHGRHSANAQGSRHLRRSAGTSSNVARQRFDPVVEGAPRRSS
jgi:hypothetical protein